MDKRIITGAVLSAVLCIGIVGLLDLDSYTGMSLLQNSYCHCYGYLTDHAGNPIQTFSQNVRVNYADLSQEYCDNVCGEHFHRFAIVHGEPVGPSLNP